MGTDGPDGPQGQRDRWSQGGECCVGWVWGFGVWGLGFPGKACLRPIDLYHTLQLNPNLALKPTP